MWIGADDKGCSFDQVHIAICIGKNLAGSFQDHFDVLCGYEQMIEDDVMT
jgi:hypothetical protein